MRICIRNSYECALYLFVNSVCQQGRRWPEGSRGPDPPPVPTKATCGNRQDSMSFFGGEACAPWHDVCQWPMVHLLTAIGGAYVADGRHLFIVFFYHISASIKNLFTLYVYSLLDSAGSHTRSERPTSKIHLLIVCLQGSLCF